jgi:hypothetical protein
VIGLLLAVVLPVPDPLLALELLELLELPHAAIAAIVAIAIALATHLRKILISVSSAPQWVSRILRAAGARPGPLTPTRCNRLQDHSRASGECQLQSCAGCVKTA